MDAFQEYLEDVLISGRLCVITFKGDNGAVATAEARITDLYREDGVVYVMTSLGMRININDIRTIDGKAAPDLC